VISIALIRMYRQEQLPIRAHLQPNPNGGTIQWQPNPASLSRSTSRLVLPRFTKKKSYVCKAINRGRGDNCLPEVKEVIFYLFFIYFVLSIFTFVYKAGLVQPTANWEKHAGSGGEARVDISEVGGLRFRRLLGQCGVIAQEYGTVDPYQNHLPQLTHIFRSLSFLQLAFIILSTAHVLHYPPATRSGHPRALIVTRGYIGGNDLPGQGQRKPSPKPPLVELDYGGTNKGTRCVSFWHSSFWVSLNFLSCHL